MWANPGPYQIMKQSNLAVDPTRSITFEVVSEAPVEDIIKLYRAGGWWRELPEWAASVPGIISGSFCFIIVRNSEKKIIGMGRVISDGVSDAYIQDVILYEEYRGLGLGQELVRRLVSYCHEHGVWWVGLIAEPGTQGFYESLDFVPLTDHMAMLHKDS
jgi:ribosomal protein S18 acetylase RimI-like enzyme